MGVQAMSHRAGLKTDLMNDLSAARASARSLLLQPQMQRLNGQWVQK
jgi:hypothetical protein